MLTWRRPGVAADPNKVAFDVASNLVFYVLPLAGPAIAFWQWANILWLVHAVLGDERRLLELMQMTLTPATNGIVIACLAIAFGTLTSVTINTLRLRQKEVRQCLNKESCEVAVLYAALQAAWGSEDAEVDREGVFVYLRCLELLRLYVARLYSESNSLADVTALQEQSVSDTELMSILSALVPCSPIFPYTIFPVRDEVAVRVVRLNDFRSDRLAALTTAFPISHWMILALLASSIACCFAIEVDQSEGRFLFERPEDSLRLRLVFTIMVGSFCGLTALCADLNDPFRGSFNIEGSARQLVTMGDVLALEASQVREKMEQECVVVPDPGRDGMSS